MPAFGDALSPTISPRDRSYADVLRRAGVAAGRPEPAARVLHREGLSRERSGVDDGDYRPATSDRSQNTLIYERRLGARNQVELVAPVTSTRTPRASGTTGSATWRSPSSARCMPAFGGDRSARPGSKSSCRPATSRADSATATRCSSRSPCGARCCRGTLSCRCTRGSSCPPIPTAPGKRSCARRSAPPSRRPRLRPRLVAAGRSVVGPAEGGPSEWDVVPQVQVTLSKLQHVMLAAGVRVPVTQREERVRRRWSICCGTGSTAGSSSCGDEARASGGPRRGGRVVGGAAGERCAPGRRSRQSTAGDPRPAAATPRCSRRRASASPATTTWSRRPAKTCRSARAGAGR